MPDLLPIEIIHFDPVTRKIEFDKERWKRIRGQTEVLYTDSSCPQFFDRCYFYSPHIPKVD